MPNTTDIYGSSVEDDKLSRQLAVLSAVNQFKQEAAQAQTQAALPTKKLGRPGYVQTEKPAGPGREAQAFTRATELGKQLGSPESYGGQKPLQHQKITAYKNLMASGQQEFAQPIAVTRGMTTTYQGPKYGQEYASSGQATQAFRREQGAKYAGETSGKDVGIQAVLDDKTRQRNKEYYLNDILKQRPDLFVIDAKGEPQIKPDYMHLLRGNLRLAEEKPDYAVKSFMGELDPWENKLRIKGLEKNPDALSEAKSKFKLWQQRDISNEELGRIQKQGRLGEWINKMQTITVPTRAKVKQAEEPFRPEKMAIGMPLSYWEGVEPLKPIY